MIPARLEDVSIDALRAEAQKIGIATEGLDKAALIAALRPKLTIPSVEIATDKARVPKPWSKSFTLSLVSLLISIVAIIVAGFAAFQEKRQADIALESLTTELRRSGDERQKQEINEWQEATVYAIIDKEFSRNGIDFKGLTFEEIKERYLDEAKAADSDLPKAEVKDSALTNILYRLVKCNGPQKLDHLIR